MTTIDAFLAIVDARLLDALEAVDPNASAIRHWVVMEDATGVECSELTESHTTPHELLESLLGRGATAAAYVTYVPDRRARVEARVRVAEPPDSDIRWAYVSRPAERSVELSAWEYKL